MSFTSLVTVVRCKFFGKETLKLMKTVGTPVRNLDRPCNRLVR